MSVRDQLRIAVDAVLARREALVVRDAAYRAMVTDPVEPWSMPRVEREMRTSLLAAGVPESELGRLGVSHDAVRRALK